MPVHELFHELDALEFQYLGILPPSRVDVCLSDQQSGLWGFSPSRPTAASGRSIRGAAPSRWPAASSGAVPRSPHDEHRRRRRSAGREVDRRRAAGTSREGDAGLRGRSRTARVPEQPRRGEGAFRHAGALMRKSGPGSPGKLSHWPATAAPSCCYSIIESVGQRVQR